jgi:ParB family transcriptional regulator, chromosome partitioning protein
MAMPDEGRSRLGRGLAALMGDVGAETATPERARNQRRVPIEYVRPNPRNPRRNFSEPELDDLAASIKERGIIQPVVVRSIAGAKDTYEIIAGERRWRAAQRAGLREIPALVKDVDDNNALALALIENIQRENLNPLEEALGLARLVDEFGLTHDAVAKAVGRSRSAVSNLMRLTQLAKPVQDHLMSGALEMGHARALLALPAAEQGGAAARVVTEALSVRDTERLVGTLINPAQRALRHASTSRDADTVRLENEVAEKLGAKVRIEPGRKGAGRVVINYNSLEELDGILAKIR